MPSKFLNISTDNTLGGSSPSDETVSSQKAIKNYVDNHGGVTYTAGTGIDITSNVISVTAPTLTNLATGSGSLILNGTAGYPSASYNVVIGQFATTGYNQTTYNTQTVLVGYNSRIRQGNHNVSIGANSGDNANSTINYVVLLGDSAKATGTGAIQLGKGVNSTAGTVGVGLTTDGITWTQYELLSSNGTIPEARLADTTGASQGQVLTLDSNLDATWATPTASVAWGGITGTLSDQTDLANALAAKADDTGVVHLAGAETITGVKTFDGVTIKTTHSTQYPNCIENTNTLIPNNYSSPSSNVNIVTTCLLSNAGDFVAYEQLGKDTSGNTTASLWVRNRADSSSPNRTGNLGVVITSNGSTYATAPASDTNGSIVTTVNKSKGTDGYFKLGNGLIVQWGTASGTPGNSKTINMPTAFNSATAYNVVTTNLSAGTGSQSNIVEKWSGSFKMIFANSNVYWIAIGY